MKAKWLSSMRETQQKNILIFYFLSAMLVEQHTFLNVNREWVNLLVNLEVIRFVVNPIHSESFLTGEVR